MSLDRRLHRRDCIIMDIAHDNNSGDRAANIIMIGSPTCQIVHLSIVVKTKLFL